MISLHFVQERLGRDDIVIGPAPWFRLTASYIRRGPHGTISGSYLGIMWEVEGRHYKTLECHSPVKVAFEDASGHQTGMLGPFQYFRVSDGVMSTEAGLLARFNEENRRWIDVQTQNIWPDILMVPA